VLGPDNFQHNERRGTMLLLTRREPSEIAILQGILHRLDKNALNFKQFEDQLARAKSGFIGEQRVDREWLDFQINKPYILLHSLHMKKDAEFTHQIDSLFISQYFILIIEVKNYSGRIEFDENTHQCTRTRPDGGVDGFGNPIDQVRRHAGFIKSQLSRLGYQLPIERAVIFSHPNAVLGKVNTDVLIFHVTGLRYKLARLFEKHQKAFISKDELHLIGQEFIARQQPRKWEPKIDLSKLRKGVLCSQCNYSMQMIYEHGKWICPRCGSVDPNAFYEALNEYRLLWSNRISNSEFREFMGIKSQKTTYRILSGLDLETEGKLRHMRYIIPPNILEN